MVVFTEKCQNSWIISEMPPATLQTVGLVSGMPGRLRVAAH
jgi:hypothetical protein